MAPRRTSTIRWIAQEVARWNLYQRERFPLAAHTPLVAAFSASAVCFSALARNRADLPDIRTFAVAFLTCLLFFLQLRIADEFKDAAEDARHRPYRPVPRGLVTLRELGWIGIAAGAVQLALALWLDVRLVAWLLLPWTWFVLMGREFFVGAWLRSRPVIYMASHMAILPLIDLYATACEWQGAGAAAPDGLGWFLLVSYANGIVIEIGRKTRVPEDEEPGVETYSAIWGPAVAARAWLLAVAATAALAWFAAERIGIAAPVGVLLVALLSACAVLAQRFVRRQKPGGGLALERAAAVWTLLMYLGLGAMPAAVRLRSSTVSTGMAVPATDSQPRFRGPTNGRPALQFTGRFQ
jgi:4-hydroxybenzoate polyprenyltransferase